MHYMRNDSDELLEDAREEDDAVHIASHDALWLLLGAVILMFVCWYALVLHYRTVISFISGWL